MNGFAPNWKKCRKLPVVVEARMAIPGETIETREGRLVARDGDLIIRGVEGELYPIGRDIFDKTYEWCAARKEDGDG